MISLLKLGHILCNAVFVYLANLPAGARHHTRVVKEFMTSHRSRALLIVFVFSVPLLNGAEVARDRGDEHSEIDVGGTNDDPCSYRRHPAPLLAPCSFAGIYTQAQVFDTENISTCHACNKVSCR